MLADFLKLMEKHQFITKIGKVKGRKSIKVTFTLDNSTMSLEDLEKTLVDFRESLKTYTNSHNLKKKESTEYGNGYVCSKFDFRDFNETLIVREFIEDFYKVRKFSFKGYFFA